MYNDNQSAYIYIFIYLLIIPDTTASLGHHYNINNSNGINRYQAESYQTVPCYIFT